VSYSLLVYSSAGRVCLAAAGAPVASEEVRALVTRLEGVLRREEERRALQTRVLAQVDALRKQIEPLERVRSSLLRRFVLLSALLDHLSGCINNQSSLRGSLRSCPSEN
jgi:hypothetical protein